MRKRYLLLGALLVAAVTWPFFLPGEFVWRDMVILDAPGWTAANFGGGDLPARNSPQDGLLAIAGLVGLGGVLARALIVGAASAAAWAGYRFGHTPVGTCAAMVLAVINPFVVERLLQGQWSLAVAAWLLPAIAVADKHRTAWLCMCGAAITPTGGLFTLATGTLTVRGRRVATFGIGTLLCLPWLVPGLLHPGASMHAAASATAFAPRAEAFTGTLGTLAGLGGIWNAAAVPASRAAGFALFGFLLAPLVVAGTTRLPRRTLAALGALAAIGVVVPLVAWLAPELIAQLLRAVPGAGLIRDSHKLVALAIPLYVAALGTLRGQTAWAGLVTAALLVPDAPWALQALTPSKKPVINEALVRELAGKDVYFADRGPLVRIDDTVSVDPYSKAVGAVESGELVVDGERVDDPAPRWLAAHAAWGRGDLKALEDLGIGAVVENDQVVAQTDAPPTPVPWALTAGWLLIPAGLVARAAALRSAGRSSATSSGTRDRAPRNRGRGGGQGHR